MLKRLFLGWAIPGWVVLAFWIAVEVLDWWRVLAIQQSLLSPLAILFVFQPFGALWYTKPGDAVSYAEHRSRSHDAVIRVYDEAGNVIETQEHKGESREA